jgi:DNA modification methylase
MLNERSISRLRRIDWDYPGSASESPFSAIHWHPARLPSQIAATLIGVLSEPDDLVVDPFVGSGTCAVEAQRLDRRFIGIDVNPIACLITRAKTLAISSLRIASIVEALKHNADIAVRGGRFRTMRTTLPVVPGVQRKWYATRVYRDLALLWDAINTAERNQRILAQAAFSAILLPVCRETRHWGYVCDNSTPKGDHERDVLDEYYRILDRFNCAYEERDADRAARPSCRPRVPCVTVHCGDCREQLKKLRPDSVDLVITSPPYFGVSDYIKSQRLSAEWFGIEIEPIRKTEIGARSKRHRLSAAKDYVEELNETFEIIQGALKPDGAFAIILGESACRESLLDQIITAMRHTGFDKALQIERSISPQRRQKAQITSETLLVTSKRGHSHDNTARSRRAQGHLFNTAEVLSSSGR